MAESPGDRGVNPLEEPEGERNTAETQNKGRTRFTGGAGAHPLASRSKLHRRSGSGVLLSDLDPLARHQVTPAHSLAEPAGTKSSHRAPLTFAEGC